MFVCYLKPSLAHRASLLSMCSCLIFFTYFIVRFVLGALCTIFIIYKENSFVKVNENVTWYTQVDDFQVFAGVGTRICDTERFIIRNQ